MKQGNNFQVVRVSLSSCSICNQCQPGAAYKSAVYKKACFGQNTDSAFFVFRISDKIPYTEF